MRAPIHIRRATDWRIRFLWHLSRTGNVWKACEDARVVRSQVDVARKDEELFRQAMDEAIGIAVEVMDAEAHRRAVEGVDEPVYQQARLVANIRRYGDTLLMFLLKSRSAKYRESTRSDVFNVDLSQFSIKQLKAIEDGVPLAQVMTMKDEPEK